MSNLTIEIETGNAAFEDDNLGFEIARILRKLADRIENDGVGCLDMGLYDINGNKVGSTNYEEG
jgi:hypothetical protein